MHENFDKIEDLISINILNSSTLQIGLSHLGLDLATPFFALHETSFDWKSY